MRDLRELQSIAQALGQSVRTFARELADLKRAVSRVPALKQGTVIARAADFKTVTLRFLDVDESTGDTTNTDVTGIPFLGVCPAINEVMWVADLGRGKLLGLGVQGSDGQAVHAYAFNGVNQNFTANVGTVVRYQSEFRDSHNAYDLATGIFTAPIAGVYNIAFSLALPFNDSSTLVRQWVAWGDVSLSNQHYLAYWSAPDINDADSSIVSASADLYLPAGGKLAPMTATTATVTNKALGTTLSIVRVGG